MTNFYLNLPANQKIRLRTEKKEPKSIEFICFMSKCIDVDNDLGEEEACKSQKKGQQSLQALPEKRRGPSEESKTT